MVLNDERFTSLLETLMSHSRLVQNNPPDDVPQEDLIADAVLDFLKPHLSENGGPLVARKINYVDKRANLVVTYKGTGEGSVGFVGMHMDVVTADEATWEFPPFELTKKEEEGGDIQLRGRGTTDCLGHVALVADLLATIASEKRQLKRSVIAVFIANEEKSDILGVGVDELAKNGELECLKNGPIYWIDSADKQPCIGTAGVIPWKLTAKGKIGHSGLPNNAVNPIILAHESLVQIMEKFHTDFAAHEKEKEYNYSVPSTMKPTQVFYPLGSQNQIPGEATISGDIRLTPFYRVEDVISKVNEYVASVNENIESLPTRGPVNRNVLPDGTRGSISIEWGSPMSGVAVEIEGDGFNAIKTATKEVLGEVKPYSITGSLPVVDSLQAAGFDLNIVGFGLAKCYHADNEYCTIEGMRQGARVLNRIIEIMDEK